MTLNSLNVGVVLPENKYKSCHSRAGGNPEQTWIWLLMFQNLTLVFLIQGTSGHGKSVLDCVIFVFKELSGKIWERLEQSFSSPMLYHVYELKNVA